MSLQRACCGMQVSSVGGGRHKSYGVGGGGVLLQLLLYREWGEKTNSGYVSLLYQIQAMIGLPKIKMMVRSAVTVIVISRVGGEDKWWVCIIAVSNTSNDRVAQD